MDWEGKERMERVGMVMEWVLGNEREKEKEETKREGSRAREFSWGGVRTGYMGDRSDRGHG